MTRPEVDQNKRIEYAPSGRGFGAPTGVISVSLGEDEDVEWCWMHYPDGRSAVTGYEIIKKARQREEDFSFERAVEGLLWPDEKKRSDDPSRADAPA